MLKTNGDRLKDLEQRGFVFADVVFGRIYA